MQGLFKFIKWLLISVLLLLFILILSIMGNVFINKYEAEKNQDKHFEDLCALYGTSEFVSLDEQQFCSFNIEEEKENLKFNEIQFLATHNSYKQTPTLISKFCFLVNELISGEKAKTLNYGFESLTDQVYKGIRSFELDVFNQNSDEGFLCVHDDMFDNLSSAINFKKALEEIALFSQNNPKHLPITILIELKPKQIYSILSKNFDSAALSKLNNVVGEALGDSLYTPKMLKGEFSNLKEVVDNNAWPTISQMLGKVLVIMHPGEEVNTYMNLDQSLDSLNLFPSVRGYYAIEEGSNLDNIAFIVDNDPEIDFDRIVDLCNAHFFVRTRIDSYPYHSNERKAKGIASLANILSGDYPPRNHLQVNDNYVSYLENEYTIKKR